MTLKEFKDKNSDIMLEELAWNDLHDIAGGEALFYVSLTGKNAPKEDRTVVYAGHAMTVGMNIPDKELLVIRLTAGGYPRLDPISADDLKPDGKAILFRTTALPENDTRNRKPWHQWA